MLEFFDALFKKHVNINDKTRRRFSANTCIRATTVVDHGNGWEQAEVFSVRVDGIVQEFIPDSGGFLSLW